MSPKKKKHPPFYRTLVPKALSQAWNDRWLWPFAVFAALLMTGGIYDVILSSLRELQTRHDLIVAGTLPDSVMFAWSRLSGGESVLGMIGAWQSIAFALIFVIALLGLSIIGQGALAHGIGGRMRGKKSTFKQSLTVGARFFLPVALLNIFTIGLTWFAKFLMFIPYRATFVSPSLSGIVLYFLTALLFIAVLIALTSIHLFTLNALILQDATLHDAIGRAFSLLRKGWLAILELAFILFGIGIAIFALTFVLFIVMLIPLLLVMIATLVLGQAFVFSIGMALASILFFTLFIAAGAFSVTFQYVAWHHLFLKLGEGGLVAKLHRFSHWLTGSYKPSRT
jgi:hypothetical protein